ncbi:MAG: FAD-dependent oxidoreductase [Deltaproteobacteria bacterium]|nr:FAD-dependent oxidoreductase [Deltaproteobacteria bacterium]
MPIGKRVVIIGGAMQGCELAEFLTIRGRKVTIVDIAEELGEGILSEPKNRLFKWMHIKKISMITEVRDYKEITRTGLTIINKDGIEQTLEADSIVTALPVVPDTSLLEKLKDKVPEIYAIGDCREPGLIAHAVADGAKIGRKV